jgi:hypothetical protein
MFLPSSPVYSRAEPDHDHKLYRLSSNFLISLERRVRVRARVLTSRVTPPECSGHQYAELDVFIAHGLSVTPWYWAEKVGRFSGAVISDESLDCVKNPSRSKKSHAREAFLPAYMTDGVEVYKNCTHLHVVTIHKDGWKSDMPATDELYDLDLYFIKVFEWPDEDEKPYVLASGSAELGTLKCPFVIPAAHIKTLESVEYWG